MVRGVSQKRIVQLGISLFVIVAVAQLLSLPGSSSVSTQTALRDLQAQSSQHLEWLLARGTQLEVSLYASLSQWILDSASDADSGVLSHGYISMLSGLQRAAFLVIASLRLWIFLFALAIYWSYRRAQPYSAPDLLGLTGNGRLFFSGVHLDLASLSQGGEPTLLVPSLVCAKKNPTSQVAASPLGKVLAHYGALNATTSECAGLILANSDVPFFAFRSDQPQSDAGVVRLPLKDGALISVRAALEVHAALVRGGPLPSPQAHDHRTDPLAHYESTLMSGFSHVLSPESRAALAQLTAAEVAAVVLACHAAKILGYIREGTRWVRRSAHLHLNGRAILHSIPDLSREFSTKTRTAIRQALVYGCRFSVFGPIRVPEDFSPQARALRQWVELSLTNPVEITPVADELSLHDQDRSLWERWRDWFFGSIARESSDVAQKSVALETGVLLVPVQGILAGFHEVASREEIQQIERLIGLVSRSQQVRQLSADAKSNAASDEEGKGPLPKFQRVVGCPPHHEVQRLAATCNLSEPLMREWLALRNIFHSSGWLARRVGDTAVPEHSCVLAVTRSRLGHRVGLRGVVPLRGSFVGDRFGRQWRSRFETAVTASVTDDPHTFDQFERGMEPRRPSEDQQ